MPTNKISIVVLSGCLGYALMGDLELQAKETFNYEKELTCNFVQRRTDSGDGCVATYWTLGIDPKKVTHLDLSDDGTVNSFFRPRDGRSTLLTVFPGGISKLTEHLDKYHRATTFHGVCTQEKK